MGEESGSDSGSADSACFGDKMCKVIENGELVNYTWNGNKFVKQVYRNGKIIEREA